MSEGYSARDVARRSGLPGPATGAVTRTAFQRDRARVLHSAALRRLAGKTQVVGVGADAFPRTRLTHSLETAQVGRELGASLGADADLVEAACLAHDLGHPPFGHNGEVALDLVSAGIGGFEGNAQSLRLLVRLETKVLDAHDRPLGLDLTRATLDAATKYPWPRRGTAGKFGVYADDRDIFDWFRAGAADDRRPVEAQVMDWADDVAYCVHDIEDGVHSRAIDLLALDDPQVRADVVAGALSEGQVVGDPAEVAAELDALLAEPHWPRGFDGSRRSMVGLKAWTSATIADLCARATVATRERYGPGPLRRYAADVQVPVAARQRAGLLKQVVARDVMSRPAAMARQEREREVLTGLVQQLSGRPDRLWPELADSWHDAADDDARLRVVVDQVASLTDAAAHQWAVADG